MRPLNPSAPTFDAFPSPLQSRASSPSHMFSPSPIAPPNSPAEDRQPKVASRLGFGWTTTFPAKALERHAPFPSGGTHTHSSSLPRSWSVPGAKPRFDPFGDEGDLLTEAVSRSLSALSPAFPKTTPVARDYDLTRDSVSAEHDMNGIPVCTPEEVGEGRNVYLPNLGPGLSEARLCHIGQQFGRVVSVKVEHSGVSHDAVDADRAYARTYAFVMFDSPLAAMNFMSKMHSEDIACQYGKETPHLKQKALEDPHSSNLYVAEIPLDATEEEMRTLLSPGVISSLRFLTDDHGNRRGTAMIRLQSRAQADEAIARLDNKWTMRGCAKKLQVRIADSEHQKNFKRTMNPLADASPSPTEASMLHQILLIQAELKRRESKRHVIDVSIKPKPVATWASSKTYLQW